MAKIELHGALPEPGATFIDLRPVDAKRRRGGSTRNRHLVDQGRGCVPRDAYPVGALRQRVVMRANGEALRAGPAPGEAAWPQRS